jgi:hypothetical protein
MAIAYLRERGNTAFEAMNQNNISQQDLPQQVRQQLRDLGYAQ